MCGTPLPSPTNARYCKECRAVRDAASNRASKARHGEDRRLRNLQRERSRKLSDPGYAERRRAAKREWHEANLEHVREYTKGKYWEMTVEERREKRRRHPTRTGRKVKSGEHSGTPWQEGEDLLILRSRGVKTDRQLAVLLKRTEAAVCARRSLLIRTGVPSQRKTTWAAPWTPEEDEFLLASSLPLSGQAEQLGRPLGAVTSRRSVLRSRGVAVPPAVRVKMTEEEARQRSREKSRRYLEKNRDIVNARKRERRLREKGPA